MVDVEVEIGVADAEDRGLTEAQNEFSTASCDRVLSGVGWVVHESMVELEFRRGLTVAA